MQTTDEAQVRPRERHRDGELAHVEEVGLTWRRQDSGSVRLKVQRIEVSSCDSVIQRPSLPGLVEEDVSRLRVLGDV